MLTKATFRTFKTDLCSILLKFADLQFVEEEICGIAIEEGAQELSSLPGPDT
jgi:hypothetical protein